MSAIHPTEKEGAIASVCNRFCHDSPVNDPSAYDDLDDATKAALAEFCAEVLCTAATIDRSRHVTSYRLKHFYEIWQRDRINNGESTGHSYVVNGAFKGAMMAAGYKPCGDDVNMQRINWRFHCRVKKQYRWLYRWF